MRRARASGPPPLRRAAQLLALREDLEIVVVRGNVDTRLRRLAEGDLDALVLAAAGLQRLGRADEIGGRLTDARAGARARARSSWRDAPATRARPTPSRAINDAPAWSMLLAERACVARLDASCNTPLGAHATIG